MNHNQLFADSLSQENSRKIRTYHTLEVAEKFSVHAVDLLFQPERCHVSEAASNLMELVHQTLQVSIVYI